MALRVLLYARVNPADRGGVQAVVHRLAAHLRRQGHAVQTAWTPPHPHPADGDRAYDLPPLIWRRGLPAPRSLVAACLATLRLARELIRLRPQIVNVHFVTADARYFLLLRPIFRYKVVLSVHGSDVLRPQPSDAPLLPRVLARADAITTVSELTAARVRAYPGVDPARVRRIPNGIDYEFWSARAGDFDAARRPPVILAVGRLDPVKGHDVLLRAFAHVRARAPEARLVIVGDGGYRPVLERLAEELGVREAVEFTGQLEAEQVRARMAGARCFVLPSRSEGLPLAPLEAMAAGIPVVAARVGGVPEILTPGTGLLVPPEDPAALAEAIAEVLLRPECSSRLLPPGRDRARAFSAAASDASYERAMHALV